MPSTVCHRQRVIAAIIMKSRQWHLRLQFWNLKTYLVERRVSCPQQGPIVRPSTTARILSACATAFKSAVHGETPWINGPPSLPFAAYAFVVRFVAVLAFYSRPVIWFISNLWHKNPRHQFWAVVVDIISTSPSDRRCKASLYLYLGFWVGSHVSKLKRSKPVILVCMQAVPWFRPWNALHGSSALQPSQAWPLTTWLACSSGSLGVC